jgi:hypothetical protein
MKAAIDGWLPAILLASTAPAAAAPVLERWSGADVPSAHRGTLAVSRSGEEFLLRFDLSALPRGAGVRRAWLVVEKEGGQPGDPIRVRPAAAAGGASAGEDGLLRIAGVRLSAGECRLVVKEEGGAR